MKGSHVEHVWSWGTREGRWWSMLWTGVEIVQKDGLMLVDLPGLNLQENFLDMCMG